MHVPGSLEFVSAGRGQEVPELFGTANRDHHDARRATGMILMEHPTRLPSRSVYLALTDVMAGASGFRAARQPGLPVRLLVLGRLLVQAVFSRSGETGGHQPIG